MPAVEKNRNYKLEITGMTHEGQGVGRIEGVAVFVDGALEGEEIEARIIKVNKSYAVGKLLNVLKASADRTEPFCSGYRRCGGCNLQHLNYPAQLAFKTKLVRDNLERIGGLKDVPVHPATGMENPLNYRNKAQFPVATVNGNVVTGFYSARSHDVIDSEECGIQDVVGDRIRKIVRKFIVEKGISVYDEATGKGLFRHIMTRAGFHTGEVMVVLVINGTVLPYSEELVGRLVSEFSDREGLSPDQRKKHGESFPPNIYEMKSIYLNVNTEKTNVVLGKRNILLYGSETIMDTIGSFQFSISPHSFFQINPIQTEVLYTKALEYADLNGTETVFDLYCGIGTISLFLSAKAKKVYGVEVVDAAIVDARQNAERNGVENAEFLVGEAEKVVPELYRQGIRADVVVLDPPRKGCEESLLQLLVEMQPKRIVYVSCNPSTLARDLKYLDANGYKAQEAQPVDMFPWTAHVESVVLITKCGFVANEAI